MTDVITRTWVDALYAEMGQYKTYKTVEYVRTEVIDLARQIAEAIR